MSGYRITKNTGPTYDACRSVRAHGDGVSLVKAGIGGTVRSCYELGYRGIRPAWLGNDSHAAAAWVAGADDRADDIEDGLVGLREERPLT